MKPNKNPNKHLKVTLCILALFASCEEFVKVAPPKGQIISEVVFESDNTAIAAMIGVYTEMMETSDFTVRNSEMQGLSADEMNFYSTSNEDMVQFAANSISPVNSTLKSRFWQRPYKTIYNTNSILQGLNRSNGVTQDTKNQLEGEAKLIRAFCHFNLVNWFGDVPLVISPDYRLNHQASRTSKTKVYEQIISDLEDAQILLSDNYTLTGGERVRPNKSTATALLARVYLYLEDWEKAELYSSNVINNIALYGLEEDLNNVFLKNSKEAIWQLMPVYPGLNTWEGNSYILTANPIAYGYTALSNQLLNSFEDGDNRRTKWIGSFTDDTGIYYYPFKYKVKTAETLSEYAVVIRLAEMFLIRAEAFANLDKISESILDVDRIRQRAGLPLLQNTNPSISRNDVLLAIEHERMVELFSEWGHRWLDLKRTNRSDLVLGIIKSDWQSTDTLYPIPQTERDNDPNLSQNEGY